ncbi:GNAT family N-acetyltransferase [Leuconostoc carnosum]|uniref:Protease synthase and sporulation negative regulatory protein PAI 1 n=2 Tax=Leuconostoc carnosum TaxID=1252 RepID=K0DA36_LEUCJ|nr:GNAT family N-acetyltransferase [Leuconostoc carnosum]AFT81710.1 protease synthase and sporulation negative regulatory protein PAI 1 [Leuconostoc carnosum JB16]KAA8328311.1 GNAT family N-acetyltransferase [Leuconostoc carnosum]KAA8370860.1 GNAT family N-acetyltransferase [Leuconostoc carnosum]KAA8382502.1 GNAT family N-acetyltransferase [Leuconostoc carnosum]
MKIKQLTISDAQELQEISIETFTNTYGSQSDMNDLNQYLKESYSIKKLKKEIENTNSSFYIFYDDNNEKMAYLKLNIDSAQSEDDFENALEIERIYIQKQHQKKGLGRQMFSLAIKKAYELNKKQIWLGVWEYNENAKLFYKHLGFHAVGEHTFNLGNDAQTDLLMSKKI